MSELIHKIHRKLRFILKKEFYSPDNFFSYDLEGEDAANVLMTRMRDGDNPLMVARFGVTEMNIVLIYFYNNYQSLFRKFYDYYTFKTDFVFYDNIVTSNIRDLSGFFPLERRSLDRFGELYLQSSRNLDILASFPWVYRKEQLIKEKFFPDCTIINAEKEFEPFNHEFPWTAALKNKKVLIVHPFEESIKYQYSRLDKIYPGNRIMPPFELRTLKAVQSLLGNETGYKTWFDAYNSMCDSIEKIDFDIAILGCGAYGFPLAAHIKKMGKKAIHLGGATQVLFGIKGKRYDAMPSINRYYNEYWIRPEKTESLKGQEKVEDSCYW